MYFSIQYNSTEAVKPNLSRSFLPAILCTAHQLSNRLKLARMCDISFGLYINSSHHLARKYARKFVRGHCLLQEANSFPRAKLEENCELRGTDNVQGQISEHIFAPNGDHCFYYPSNLFCNAHSFENWGIFSDIPQF